MPELTETQWQRAAASLACVGRCLDELERKSGRRICLCLEPEPGCALQYSTDVVRFFERYLDRAERPELIRRYLGVCHDICHANVMFESQSQVIGRYHQAGIHVGKVQVSSSLQAYFPPAEPPQLTNQRLEHLERFAEDRYLHQTNVRLPDKTIVAYEDLPTAIRAARWRDSLSDSEWRVHFHVPIYAAEVGSLGTGQSDIHRCLELLRPSAETHFEVETYAWNVLPEELQPADLSAGITREMRWFQEAMTVPPAGLGKSASRG